METPKFNELLKRIKFDEDAYIKLYRHYFWRIVVCLTKTFKDYALAQDAVQVFFDRIRKRKLPDYVETPIAWLYTACKNVAINLIEKDRGQAQKIQVGNFDDDALAPDFEAATMIDGVSKEDILATRNEADDYFNVLLQAGISEKMVEKLKLLDKITVEILIMHYWEGWQITEIADKLNLNYNTVKSKFRRGKFFLKNNFLFLHLFAWFFRSLI